MNKKMSLITKKNNTYFIDHHKFISDVYKNVFLNQGEKRSFRLRLKLFCILKNNNTTVTKRKRTYDDREFQAETADIKEEYENFKTQMPFEIVESIQTLYNIANTEEVRTMSQQLFEGTIFDHCGTNGGNNSIYPLNCKIGNDIFLIPPQCRFFSGSIKEQCLKLVGSQFDILVADPPWWNKYIRRLKSANNKLSYSMMYNEDIAELPVKNLLSDNCLVAVWCTNSPSNIAAVKNMIFPKWGVTYVTTWIWLKVTTDLEPLCPFAAGCEKQPYERLLIGKLGQLKKIPERKLIISVPSALHSHKPPLLDLLKPYVDAEDPQTLELFARYLLPNTTSIGFEPLKWQHISLYEQIKNKSDNS